MTSRGGSHRPTRTWPEVFCEAKDAPANLFSAEALHRTSIGDLTTFPISISFYSPLHSTPQPFPPGKFLGTHKYRPVEYTDASMKALLSRVKIIGLKITQPPSLFLAGFYCTSKKLKLSVLGALRFLTPD